MNTNGLIEVLEATRLTHYSIACLVRNAFPQYRFQILRENESWCVYERGIWYVGREAYHSLREGISSELAPFVHGHLAQLIRTSDDEELIARLQRLELMLLDAPQKDWIMRECESIMFLRSVDPIDPVEASVTSFYI